MKYANVFVIFFVLSLLSSCSSSVNVNKTNNESLNNSMQEKLTGDDFVLKQSPRKMTNSVSSGGLLLGFSTDGVLKEVLVGEKRLSSGKDGGFVLKNELHKDNYYLTGDHNEGTFSTLMRNIVLVATYNETQDYKGLSVVNVTGRIKSPELNSQDVKLSFRLPVNFTGWDYELSDDSLEFNKDNVKLGMIAGSENAEFHYSQESGAYVEFDMTLQPSQINEFSFLVYGKS